MEVKLRERRRKWREGEVQGRFRCLGAEVQQLLCLGARLEAVGG
jgi:hypothetical protein